jgi:hypothetical protein
MGPAKTGPTSVAAHLSKILLAACILILHPDHGFCSCYDSGCSYVINSCCVTSFCFYYLGFCYHFFCHSLTSSLYLGYGCSSCLTLVTESLTIILSSASI